MRRHAAIALTGIVILVAASASALVAHVLVDRLGDTLLTTDTYDHVSHRSRFAVFATGASIIVFLLARLWSAIFTDAHRSSTSMRETIARAARRCSHPFALLATIVLAVVAVVAMEDFDVLRAGGADVSLQAALGGSLWLGLCVTAFVAAVVITIVALGLRGVSQTYRLLVAVIRDVLLAIRAMCGDLRPLGVCERPRFALSTLRNLVHRAAKRGPPSFLASDLVSHLRQFNASVRRSKRRAYRMEFFRVLIHAPLHYGDSAPTHLVAWSFDRECRRTDG